MYTRIPLLTATPEMDVEYAFWLMKKYPPRSGDLVANVHSLYANRRRSDTAWSIRAYQWCIPDSDLWPLEESSLFMVVSETNDCYIMLHDSAVLMLPKYHFQFFKRVNER